MEVPVVEAMVGDNTLWGNTCILRRKRSTKNRNHCCCRNPRTELPDRQRNTTTTAAIESFMATAAISHVTCAAGSTG